MTSLEQVPAAAGGTPDLTTSARYLPAPADRCDIVMKGGISSGVIYPRAVCTLAQRYRLASVGGTSAGAIAAAAAAAAEHGRERDGFVKLARLPDELGATLADLFQPAPSTRRAFDILTTWIAPAPTRDDAHVAARSTGQARNLAKTAAAIAAGEPGPFAAALAAVLGIPALIIAGTGALTIGSWLGWAVLLAFWLPVAVATATAIAAVRFTRATLTGLAGNGYGLCDGHHRSNPTQEPLTDWMQATFDDLAGKASTTGGPGSDTPLTFADLWGADAVQAQQAIASKDAAGEPVDPSERIAARELRHVDLVVMTTNLSFQRPYRFPFTHDTFYFCRTCLHRYFDNTLPVRLRL